MSEHDEQPHLPGQPKKPSPAELRMRHQAQWVELQLQRAIAEGKFDNLPGAGKPLPPLDNDPDWWLKKLVEREQVTGVLPEALQLRKVDADLTDQLDQLRSEKEVREELESFNRRVVNARRQLLGGPPVVTPLREVEVEVEAWKQRRKRF